MQLLYTNAPTFYDEQPEPHRSLGGFVSSTRIPNNSLNSLFSSISSYTREHETQEHRGVVIQNVIDDILTPIYVHLEGAPEQAMFEVAFVTVNAKGRMELINAPTDSPYYGDFIAPFGEANKVRIADSMKLDDMIGMWIRRKAVFKKFDCVAEFNIYKANKDAGLEQPIPPKSEGVRVVISWD